jgi:hypothetical protein
MERAFKEARAHCAQAETLLPAGLYVPAAASSSMASEIVRLAGNWEIVARMARHDFEYLVTPDLHVIAPGLVEREHTAVIGRVTSRPVVDPEP